MSYQIFKQNMLLYMSNQNGIEQYQDWCEKFTNEYDLLIRRGFQTINQVSIQKGNKELMLSLVNVAALQSLQLREGNHDIINKLGKAMVGYWTGATLNQFPTPIIPAIGSIQNITTTSATVTSPGKFPDLGVQFPTDDIESFLNQIINGINIHLLSIKGIYNTLSLYPTAPPTIAPGFLEWTGYQIPGAGGPRPRQSLDVFNPPAPQQVPNPLTPEQVQAKQQELVVAQQEANDTGSPPLGRQTAQEYVRLMESELQSNSNTSVPIATQPEQLAEQAPVELSCGDGLNVVRSASRDIGVIEYGAPDGRNWGGGGPSSAVPGRIDEMLRIAGLNNQEKVARTGSGYYWCAAAVAAWWSEAGLPLPPSPASCDSWMNWGRNNGWFSNQPKIGAAVLYGTPSDANHIGIVSGILPDGRVVSIEGNTSGGGFNRNGVGVFTKTPSPGKIIGFVHPPECSE